ncbi:uncharacterized protein LOC107762014 isoform X1 [Nicotiana tabacum]|uniref:Uncharacterized protein isoform X1 n=4 Tax=Nicotiana tabacum TaxID=4097 RepID=A0A1S3X7E6_TOBAC|nr:uncharacterized protein LOC104095991 isoform X1 [Nicotiana tomentosiformis]XP_009600556.1 uncharacterized protein LOC104095991 isoform X1 [Nicotiana tomentosiformis]XP_009600558.1 uncharacterized protein LOC104095991 isoform X1 [Nicotiana tomentosiformis]XP_016435806.1 PREDICTED: uncharacterized protein LOC107762014 isoform X1 [Nicotiana tabacum]XP_016435807.1 PREDICTED: uncharacterized protein LOC107762014 isoform X1 [Nicotiana tabacum]XP_016435808.1 PREDICTED: uncharacterized protein LOC1
MRETERKRGSNTNQAKRAVKTEKRDYKQEKSTGKTLKAKETDHKASPPKPESSILVSDSNTGTEPTEVYENVVIDYVDDVYRSEEATQQSKTRKMVDKQVKDKINDHSSDMESEPKEGMEEESDIDTINDSVSSQGDPQIPEDENVERASTVKVSKKLAKSVTNNSSPAQRAKSDQKANNSQIKATKSTANKAKTPKKDPSKVTSKSVNDNSKNMKVHPKSLSDSSEEGDEKLVKEVDPVDILDETSISAQSVGSDDETVNTEENCEQEDKAALEQKIGQMESRLEKLEEELREVAALEISLYSVVSEHGSSAHKLHTPARRLSRLYLHACKYWSQDKRATVAKNTVSGLVLVAKSCGNDVARLTFWLSNAVVLRVIISQAFGSSCSPSSLVKITESNGGGKKTESKISSFKWKTHPGNKQSSKHDLLQFLDDWQETRTFTAALERVESWIFLRIVESIWWQTLTPNMQSPTDDPEASKSVGRLLGPALGDQQQGNFSINLWKNAFQEALKRLCPVRAGSHECGCLPVLARRVIEQCVARLDVAMFNAILRESAHEIPTDPISDPIVDSKVLPIPAGDLSFGSGAQLKNSVGNWSRCLTDLFGIDAEDSGQNDEGSFGDDQRKGGNQPEHFHLLNALSDLLMLPKDMLMDRTIRMEVCPSISLPLVKRILCNFSPDEFCPDPVPGALLEALNAECIIARRLSGDSSSSFPYPAASVAYKPPVAAEVAEKVAEVDGKSHLSRSASAIQRKGYTSDEELEEIDSPLACIIDKMPSSPASAQNGNGKAKLKEETGFIGSNTRYDLLREVWQTT